MSMTMMIKDPVAEGTLVKPQDRYEYDYGWLDYFSPRKAFEQVSAHIATLGSTGNTNNTLKIYMAGLRYFFEWIGADNQMRHPFPDTYVIERFIAHLMYEKPNQRGGQGLSATTIASKYLAPLRLYVKKLRLQRIEHGNAMLVMQYKGYLDEVLQIKNPKPKRSSNLAALDRHGNRLTLAQVNEIFMSFDVNTLRGQRDYALFYLGFTSAFRLSELMRLTLNDIRPIEDGYECRVRGKRNNEDPVFVEPFAVEAIRNWISAYNEPFEEGDPRRIERDTPIWQPLGRWGHRREGHLAKEGMHHDSVAKMIKRISQRVIGIEISPHDLRRTYAALARYAGVDLDAIQNQLRHKSLETTKRYIGVLVQKSKSSLSRQLEFAKPKAAS